MDSNKKVSRVAGILNLVIAVCAPFSIIFVPSKLIVAGNASLTASNIIASEMLFRAASVISIIVHIIQILFVFLLYKLLKKINKTNALLMIIFSLIGVSIALFNELNQFAVLLLLNGSDYLKVFNINQLQSLAMFFLNLHSQGLLISQIFWGIWLFPLGYLILKSGEIPKFIGILLIIAYLFS